ncbi:MAG TPA: hypothetical protein VLN90_08695, partial [Thioalkalivibrio sp.]|nr:hypothetical protein [Thioalkalivibrio sp.]
MKVRLIRQTGFDPVRQTIHTTKPWLQNAQLSDLRQSVQRNCDIADARHAGNDTLCTYLLKMREFYRW